MSLVRIALRIAAIEALKGNTMVGDNVLDSEIGSLQVNADGSLRTAEDAPFVTVYTDAASTEKTGNPLRSMLVNGATDIVFEAGITSAMTENDPDTDESRLIGIGTPATDRGFEFALDMTMRQIADALSDPENEWAQIFQSFIGSVSQVDRARTSGDSNGVRLAGHQLKLTALLIVDPIKGEELKPTSAMAKFMAKAASITDPTTAAHVAMIAAQLTGSPLPEHLAQRRYGWTGEEAEALGIRPVDPEVGTIGEIAFDAIPGGAGP